MDIFLTDEEIKLAKEKKEKEEFDNRVFETILDGIKISYKDKIKNICWQLESEIRKDYQIYNVEHFKDHIGLASSIVFEAVNEKYSEEVLTKNDMNNFYEKYK